MNKTTKIFFLAFIGFLSCNPLFGTTKTEKKPEHPDQAPMGRPKQDHPYVLVEGKAGYFFPSSSKFRRIYSGAGIYGYEVSAQAYKDLYAWTSASYLSKSGHSLGLHNRTHLQMVPIGFGLKYMGKVNILDLYAGIGGLLTYAHIRDHSDEVRQKISTWGGGLILKAGVLINLPHRLFIDIYTDYSFMWLPYHNNNNCSVTPHSADVSGTSLGGGFGYRF